MARRAASRIEPGQLDKLESLAGRMEALCRDEGEGAIEEIAILNDDYHALLMAAAGSPRLQRLLETIVQVPVSRRSYHHYTREELAGSMHHHRELLRALAAGDGEWAASVMRAHLLAARAARCASPPAWRSPRLPGVSLLRPPVQRRPCFALWHPVPPDRRECCPGSLVTPR
ncbi:hypothetical protein Q427_18375 [Halomonas sp. BC04]|nr:hypothetical protein Q427_18375 [Halomonas sp. BC04]